MLRGWVPRQYKSLESRTFCSSHAIRSKTDRKEDGPIREDENTMQRKGFLLAEKNPE
ncbi:MULTISPECIES: hypothetical protein [Methanosarcina]|uniref:hypothetical protein n=1 Tax=Methanosarcina TaxID=2207 RepID=UPI000AC6EAD2|nr:MULTISPECIES: hypothetical protein [Methanosarcina]NLO29386.1 hypothetical protein [Methanosarcina mazei]